MLRECPYCHKVFDRERSCAEDDFDNEVCNDCSKLLNEYNRTHPQTDKDKIKYMREKK